ncbi:MAG: glycosyltransferase [Candidatus Saganbacteria bacterium]|nr:glycosyltransferase [Candidatus Saganbacteria bacterium]
MNNKKRILYLFSDTGGGHRSAVKAKSKACEKSYGSLIEQDQVEVFVYTNSFLAFLAKLYGPIIRYFPNIWKNLFYHFENSDRIAKIEKMGWPFMLRKIDKLIKQYRPDILVSTHPVSRMVFRRVKEQKLNIKLVSVIMDPYSMHRMWVMPESDLTIVGSEHAKELSIKYGLKEESIKVCGTPIDPKFCTENTKKDGPFTILVMGGGEGSGNIYEIVREINQQKIKARLIIIAGRNKKLKERLENSKDFTIPMRVFGFTDKVAELMADSDLIVTKAGPGTIAEAMAMRLPMIITDYVPGNEEGNIEFVQKEKIGKYTVDPKIVAKQIKELKEGTEYQSIKKNIERLRKPRAAFAVADLIRKLLKI